MSKPERRPAGRATADVPGVMAGTVLAGGAVVYLLNDQGVLRTGDLGLTTAVLVVAAGVIGLAASRRG